MGLTLRDDVSGLTHDSAHLFVLFITHTSRHSKGDKNVGSGWALNNMVISRRRSLRLAATGLCLHDHHRCTNAFGVSPTTRLAGRSVMRPSVTRVGSTVDVGRRNGVVDTAWTGTEVRRDRQTDRARERDVKKYWSCAVQTTRHEKFRACLGVCSVSEVRKHVWQDSSPSRLRCFEGGGHLRELYRLSWLGGEGVIVAQTWPAVQASRLENHTWTQQLTCLRLCWKTSLYYRVLKQRRCVSRRSEARSTDAADA